MVGGWTFQSLLSGSDYWQTLPSPPQQHWQPWPFGITRYKLKYYPYPMDTNGRFRVAAIDTIGYLLSCSNVFIIIFLILILIIIIFWYSFV